jgi:RND family efflux transporter MFP subunit
MKPMNVETAKWRRDGIEEVPVDETVVVVRKRRNRRNLIIALIAVVVIAIAAFLLLGPRGEAPTAPPEGARKGGGGQVPTVTVIVPGRQQVGRTVTATGSLAARRDMPIGVPGEGGRVVRVLVEQGQWVGAGQVLATIDRSVQTQEASQLAASIQVAQADLRLAQQNLERSQRLVARGFVSRADIDRLTATRDAAAARVRVAQAQLGGARARIGRLDIRAPASGLVLDRNIEAGQVVSGGSQPVFRLAEGGQMELLARLPQDELARLSVGVPATVTPVGSTQSFQGQIWQISPLIDAATRQGEARIAIPYDRNLRPGGFATAVLQASTSVATVLPESAVQSDDRGNFVYVVNDANEIVRRDVRIGEVSDTGISILEGLAGNEKVVESAGAFLNPGQKVRPEQRRQ